MVKKSLGVYIGQEPVNGWQNFLALSSKPEGEIDLFLIINIIEGFSKEQGHRLTEEIKKRLLNQPINTLHQLDDFISNFIKENNLPASLSLAVIYFIDKVVYLKTVGQGVIFLKRGLKLTKIISDNQTASGYYQLNDYFILTTNDFINTFEKVGSLEKIIDKKLPNEIVDEIKPLMTNLDQENLLATFIKVIIEKEESDSLLVGKPNFLQNTWQILKQYQEKKGKRKIYNLIFIFILVIILFWSVGLGVVRREQALKEQKINQAKTLITQKLNQAEETAFFNLEEAKNLIEEAKNELTKLKQELKINEKNKNDKQINNLENLIKEKENKIIKKEEKNFIEFYDLTVDQKEAKGSQFYLADSNLLILDKDQGLIYQLSLTKKSLNKFSDEKIKKAKLIGGYDNKVFFLIFGDGVYEINGENKTKKVLESDKDWGEIKAMSFYNQNLYLLDSKKNQIYKYLFGEEGYGAKQNYLEDNNNLNFFQANSMAIDGAIYVGTNNLVLKFNLGQKDNFETSFFSQENQLAKIYTNKDLDYLYLWSKEQGRLYILNKKGSYQKQIVSSVFKQGQDVVVFEKNAYILVKEKIYKVELD